MASGELVKSIGKLLEATTKNPRMLIPIIGATALGGTALSAFDSVLAPTLETAGLYAKNKLVPGLDQSNAIDQAKLDAIQEYGAKQIPMLAAGVQERGINRDLREEATVKAMQQLPTIMAELESDPYLASVDRDKLIQLVSDALRIAPNTFEDNKSLATSVIRAAALSGADSLDPQTVKTLSDIEAAYTGAK